MSAVGRGKARPWLEARSGRCLGVEHSCLLFDERAECGMGAPSQGRFRKVMRRV